MYVLCRTVLYIQYRQQPFELTINCPRFCTLSSFRLSAAELAGFRSRSQKVRKPSPLSRSTAVACLSLAPDNYLANPAGGEEGGDGPTPREKQQRSA